jgi:hypothetical protein
MTFQELMRDYGFNPEHCQAADYLGLPAKALLKLRMDHGEAVLKWLETIAWAKSRALEENAKKGPPPLAGAGPAAVVMET